ncbi:NAD(P)/FAD-dependent oxidoreductase [Tropicimonas sediminicola]|uniref:L-2-hydroxyglutarate oxidase LhgO n=1 Tax=Tropicimonas sediminicola TaxID=1031541 RepID=A0A239IJ94_9RHOB|nr:NAD(P)/FAD-dependent oxidoreductase [Tropicimonas sediminicola]SNS93482.1 L-2-hydroxyglutarate oxidase LhgO [Tropicimonas sediminicola]
MPDFDAIVVGGGVVGLACAAAFCDAGRPALVLEGAEHAGTGTSSRNSEVVHGGLYYATGSLKHRLCVRGRRLLYDYLQERKIPHRKCGKIVVATDAAEIPWIEDLARRAEENGVEGIRMLERSEVSSLEPELTATAALLSPETGILDSHAFMMALIAQIEAGGGHVALRAPFLRAEAEAGGFRVWTGGSDPAEVTARVLINSAGLHAAEVARRIAGMPGNAIPVMRFAKGCYFCLRGRVPFRRLVYPAPVDGGLGIHATLDIGGRMRFGPDVEWLPPGTEPDALDYSVPPERARAFETAIRRYWPGLLQGALYPDYAGVRPKLSPPGAPAADFSIQTAEAHGIPGLVNLFGMESPALTSALAIGESVREALRPEIESA